MPRGLLPEHIGPLVDRLRAGDHQAVSLPDVAALTEVLMRSLESYFKSIDLTIYEECQSLADYIDDARSEISSLSPDHSDDVGIPRAGLELAAIVEQTESATNTIMSSAEEIMDADQSDAEAYANTVNDSVMKIFEACSFQDITGQRISKVVSTLEHVEDRVGRLINILGVMESNKPKEESKDAIDEDSALLNGPALDGEGIDQSAIDDLLNDTVASDPIEIDIPEEKEAEEAEVAAQPAEDEGEPESVATANEGTSAEDIDFMFSSGTEANEEKVDVEETPNVAEAAPEAPTTPEPEVKAELPQPEVMAEPEPEPEVMAEPEPEPNLIEQAKLKKAQAQAAKRAEMKPPKPVAFEGDGKAALKPKATENTTQSDIDALFS